MSNSNLLEKVFKMATAQEPESENKMFGPLLFENCDHNLTEPDSEVTCLLCDNTFNLPLSFQIFVKHLFEVHNLVIEEVQNIPNLPEYLRVWRDKFKEQPIEELLPAVKVNSTEIYFMLSTLLKEDKDLRHRLNLEHVLKVQDFERTDVGYNRMCLFCKLNFEGTRHDFISHLENQHNLQLGNPQNLVYVEELISKIDDTINKRLVCVYCNRVFPEKSILKEHMRKKLHKRLNRRNKDYDKYFMINYLQPDKKVKCVQRDDCLIEDEGNKDEDYYDWNEKEDFINCLFCEKRETNINTLCLHMEADHEFDFSELTKDFDFYQKVKFINYVRRQMHNKKCLYCDKGFPTFQALQAHLYEEGHCRIPEIKVFDQPEFYFPTYENDAFLYLIDDVED